MEYVTKLMLSPGKRNLTFHNLYSVFTVYFLVRSVSFKEKAESYVKLNAHFNGFHI